jgi:hypothetical protein
MSDCPNLPACGFMKKYGTSKELACKGFVALFCRGDKQCDCLRKQYRQTNGCAPPDDMMPNGLMLTV